MENRSLTEQVEHWARLGELVESVLSGLSVRRLKTVSHDEGLRQRLAAADTPAGRQKTIDLVRERGGPRFGIDPDDPEIVIRYEVDGRETRGTVVDGEFTPSSSRQ